MKKLKVLSIVCVSLILFSGCMPSQATGMKDEDIDFIQLKEPKEGQEIAIITTSLGKITMVLFQEQAPKTVANFKQLIKEGYYNGKDIFVEKDANTVLSGFQEDITTNGKVVTGDKKPIPCEVTPNLWHFSGAVSVLGYEKNKFSQKKLSDSRFFIVGNVPATAELASEMEKYGYPKKVVDKYKEQGGLPQYTGSYTVFAQVIEGLDVVNQISKLEVTKETRKPVKEVKIEKVELSKYKKAA